jgi:hypothetical protein
VRWWLKQPRREALVDFFSEKVVRVWLMLDPQNDLSMEECGDDEIGKRPEWLQYELENMSWSDILDARLYGEHKLSWMLENGIAPGQPFLVELPHPHYSKSWTDCGYEYDTDYAPEIIRLRPMKPSQIANLLEREQNYLVKARAWKAEYDAKQQFLVRTNVKAMFIETQVYFGQHQSSYDDMCMPSGIRYDLCSNASIDKRVRGRWRTATLAQGEDDDGEHNKAFERLVDEATKRLPGLSPEVVRALPRRSSHW